MSPGKKYECSYRSKAVWSINKVACSTFGHPAQTSFFKKYKLIQVKKSFENIVNEISILKLFELSNGDFYFRSLPTVSTKCGNLE